MNEQNDQRGSTLPSQHVKRPALIILGVLSSIPLGLALLIFLAILTDKSLALSWFIFSISVCITSFFWIRRYRSTALVTSFFAGLLFGFSFVQILIAFVLVLQHVPKSPNRPRQPNQAFNPDPAATIHHALSCSYFPVSVPRPACGWAG